MWIPGQTETFQRGSDNRSYRLVSGCLLAPKTRWSANVLVSGCLVLAARVIKATPDKVQITVSCAVHRLSACLAI